MSAPARNSSCPCGSGRRYKDCHGALGAPPPAPVDAGTDRHSAALAGALAAQREGDLAAAEAGYRSVLAEAPDHFDAMHMLGVVMLQQKRLHEAEALIARAAALRPDIATAQYNLGLVRQARVVVAEEERICCAVLPRLAPLCVNPPPPLFAGVGPGDPVHVLFAGSDSDVALAQRIARAAVARGASVSAESFVYPEPPGWPIADEQRLAALADVATVVIVGLDVPVGDWPLTAAPRSTTLVATRDAPCLLLDRVREASGQGRRLVALATDAAAVAEAAILPMWTSVVREDT